MKGTKCLMQHSIQQDDHVRITEIKDGNPVVSKIVPYESACETSRTIINLGIYEVLMDREGHTDDTKFFIGTEVEHSPAHGQRTLFVVGLQPKEEILARAFKL